MNKGGIDMEDQIRALVASERGMALEEIKLSSDLLYDLGIAGDDGVELMEEFAQKFDVDLAGFNPYEFFGPEGCNPFAIFFPSFWKKHPTLTVADLVQMAEARSWASFSAGKHAPEFAANHPVGCADTPPKEGNFHHSLFLEFRYASHRRFHSSAAAGADMVPPVF